LAQQHIECAHCGNQELQQIPGVWSPLVLTQEGQVPGPAVPIVMRRRPVVLFVTGPVTELPPLPGLKVVSVAKGERWHEQVVGA
jgi:hypothetical protein